MASFLNKLFGSPYRKYNIELDETFNNDPLAWSRPLVKHHCGEFSMAAVQANMDMEDQSQVEVDTDKLFVGVYDGHKGDTTAIYLRDHIFSELLTRFQQNIRYIEDPAVNFGVAVETMMRQSIREMETRFIEYAKNSFEQQNEIQNSFVSSGCLICIIWKGTICVANVGNSRAILGSQKGIGPLKRLAVEQMVIDHSFQNPAIQQEFLRCYPDRHSHYQCIQEKGLSETSSCIGYAYMKNARFTQRRPFEIPLSELVTSPFNTFPLLSSHPSVSSRRLRDSDRFIIFGSGGFWKLISNEKAAGVVNNSSRDRIAERLVTLALEEDPDKKGRTYRDLVKIPKSNCISGNNGNQNSGFRSAYHDDITVIVVYLDKMPNGEGVRPEINSYRGYDNTVRQSEFRNFNNKANA
ncbi:hypothetical protein TSUD_331390 [Trifolium subterraneum]|uniref:PPM-type phosphatase domain-containing protein n=1 Tax=Trifolium subterraneum TaxID=3900 RepID=A0A2Z6LVD3_TRISU|nr:hypothetical protein TSUD_331390 [Trifolium subterraneum]